MVSFFFNKRHWNHNHIECLCSRKKIVVCRNEEGSESVSRQDISLFYLNISKNQDNIKKKLNDDLTKEKFHECIMT